MVRNPKIFLIFTQLLIAYITHAQVPVLDWATQFSGNGSDYGYALTIDKSGKAYTTGNFNGTNDFDPGTGSYNLTSTGTVDAFVCKLDAGGNFVWARSFGGAAGFIASGRAIAVDASSNVYFTGNFTGTVDFDPGTGTANMTSAGNSDVFVTKLDAAGNFVWAKRFGSTSNDYSFGICLDASANVFTTGNYTGTVDFDPGAGTATLTSAGSSDIFISKLSTSGNYVWAKSIGSSTGGDSGQSLTCDAAGNVYTTGNFSGTTPTDFDPGIGSFNMTSSGLNDIFIVKLDAAGVFGWARKMGGTDSDYGYGIALDPSNNVYTTGLFNLQADFDPGPATYNLTSAGDDDIFVSKLDAGGNFVWAKRMGGTAGDVGLSIDADNSGNAYTTGYFYSTADFDPGNSLFNLTAPGTLVPDVFISKLDAAGNFIWAGQLGGTYNDNGYSIAADSIGNIYTTGFFGMTADFDPGPATYNLISNSGTLDIFVHKMHLCNSSTSAINVTACDSYVSPDGNHVWASTNTYMDTIANARGCDSIITINLTVNHSSDTNIAPVACYSYTSPSGNHIWTVSNIYQDTIPNASGCDSIINIDLTIYTADVSVTVNDPVLVANATPASYQWIDCNNGFLPVTGQTGQSFTAPANGSYAVIVHQNGCVDTSACYTILTVGIPENTVDAGLRVYPNPSDGKLTIEYGTGLNILEVRITDLAGRTIFQSNIENRKTIRIEDLKYGIYILTLIDGHLGEIYRKLLSRQ